MTFAELKTQFSDILNNSLCTTAQRLTFFSMAHQLIQRQLRIQSMENVGVIDTTAAVDTVALPADFLEMKTVVCDDVKLEYLDLGAFTALGTAIFSGTPKWYTRKAGNLLFMPYLPADATAFVSYYGELTELADDADETILAQIAPDVLLYAALSYAGDVFLDDRTNGWRESFTALMQGFQDQADRERATMGFQRVQAAYNLNDGYD